MALLHSSPVVFSYPNRPPLRASGPAQFGIGIVVGRRGGGFFSSGWAGLDWAGFVHLARLSALTEWDILGSGPSGSFLFFSFLSFCLLFPILFLGSNFIVHLRYTLFHLEAFW